MEITYVNQKKITNLNDIRHLILFIFVFNPPHMPSTHGDRKVWKIYLILTYKIRIFVLLLFNFTYEIVNIYIIFELTSKQIFLLLLLKFKGTDS